MADNKLSLIVSFIGQDKLSAGLRGIIGLGKSGSQALKGLNREAGQIATAMRKNRDAINDAMRTGKAGLTELIAKERELAGALAKVNEQRGKQRRLNEIDGASAAIGNRASALQSQGTANLFGAAAMAAPIVFATKQAMTFEAAMADVRKVVNFDNPRQFEQMGKDILTLSTQIPMASEGIAAIVAAAGRAGIARSELMAFAGDAAKMGIAFDISADEAGSSMAKWRTAFKLGQSDVVALADRINALTNSYGGNAAAVSGIVTRIGALGKVAGVTAPQVAAMAQLLNSVGVEEEVAATGIKRMMLSLTAGSAATKGQKTVLASLGLDPMALASQMQTDSSGAISGVLSRIARLPKAGQASALSELFGSESVAAIAPMLTNLDQLQRNLALVGNKAAYAGSANKEFLSRIATTEGATGLAANAFKAVNIEIGQQMLPYVTDASKALVGMAQGFRAFTNAHPGVMKLVGGFLLAGTALAGVRLSLGILQFGFGTVLGPMGKAWAIYAKFKEAGTIATAFSKVSGAAKLLGNAALIMGRGFLQAGLWMLANPMVLLIVAIGVAIAGLAYLVYANWGKIRAAFAAGWQWVKDTLSAAPGWLAGLGGAMMSGLLSMIDPFGLRNRLLEVARNGVNAFKAFFGIKSPSRLMMAMGGHMTAGLAAGIDGGRGAPLRSMGRMASAVAGAGALSLAGPSFASPAGSGSAAAVRGGTTINITIQQQPGEDAQALAERVARLLDQRAARTRRSSYQDDF